MWFATSVIIPSVKKAVALFVKELNAFDTARNPDLNLSDGVASNRRLDICARGWARVQTDRPISRHCRAKLLFTCRHRGWFSGSNLCLRFTGKTKDEFNSSELHQSTTINMIGWLNWIVKVEFGWMLKVFACSWFVCRYNYFASLKTTVALNLLRFVLRRSQILFKLAYLGVDLVHNGLLCFQIVNHLQTRLGHLRYLSLGLFLLCECGFSWLS